MAKFVVQSSSYPNAVHTNPPANIEIEADEGEALAGELIFLNGGGKDVVAAFSPGSWRFFKKIS